MRNEKLLSAARQMIVREAEHFRERTARSKALSEQAAGHWLGGVPLHWMTDWQTPHPLFLAEASGAALRDVDGNEYVDFCLGDTGAMFGHVPAEVGKAISERLAAGATTMLPSPDAVVVGEMLSERFGLDVWQVTATASDANRAIIRWARGVTGRKRILIFDGSYHGAVDDVFVRIAENGGTELRPGLVGQVYDMTEYTAVVPFNDRDAVQRELAKGDIALVLTEPVMTNIGMVPCDEGFIEWLRDAARESGALFALDETHTISTGPGGWGREYGVLPDFVVVGKPIGGGIPTAVYGMSRGVAEGIALMNETRPPGHSGIGTTLSGSPLQMAAIRTMLEKVMTPEAYATMRGLAERLERGIASVFDKRGMDWHVTRVGTRTEFGFEPEPPRTGAESVRGMDHDLERAIHLYLLNRGLVITPFHNMMLVCPATRAEDVDRLITTLDACIGELGA